MSGMKSKLFLLVGSIVLLVAAPILAAPLYVSEDWESGWSHNDYADGGDYSGYDLDDHGSYVKNTVARDTLALELETVPAGGQYFIMDLDDAARTGTEVFDVWFARGTTCGNGVFGVYSIGGPANFYFLTYSTGLVRLYGATSYKGAAVPLAEMTASEGNWYHTVVTCNNDSHALSAAIYNSSGGLLDSATGYYPNTYDNAYAAQIKFQGGNAANGSFWYFDDIVYDIPEPVTLLVLLAGASLVQLRRRRA